MIKIIKIEKLVGDELKTFRKNEGPDTDKSIGQNISKILVQDKNGIEHKIIIYEFFDVSKDPDWKKIPTSPINWEALLNKESIKIWINDRIEKIINGEFEGEFGRFYFSVGRCQISDNSYIEDLTIIYKPKI